MPPILDHHGELQTRNRISSDLYIAKDDDENIPTKAAPKKRDKASNIDLTPYR